MTTERKPSTIYEVARRAHVSISTVSRVINGYTGVEERTRERVWEAIRELDYPVLRRPQAVAHILVWAPKVSFATAQWRFITSGILDEASRWSIPVMFSNTRDAAEVRTMINTLARRDGVIGVIRACFPLGMEVDGSLLDDPRVVSVSVLINHTGHTVGVDTCALVMQLTQTLHRLGHRRVSLVINALDYWPVHRRLEGYTAACRACGITPDVANVAPSSDAPKWLHGALAGPDPPTALIGGTTELAKQLWAEITRRQIKVPEELSFVGIGHRTPFEAPLFDTILQPTFEMGVEAVRTLLRVAVAPEGETVVKMLPAQFVKVGAVGRAPGGRD